MVMTTSSKSGAPEEGGKKVNFCSRHVVKRKTSALASDFPKHSRFPNPQGTTAGWGENDPLAGSTNLVGSKESGSGKFLGSRCTSKIVCQVLRVGEAKLKSVCFAQAQMEESEHFCHKTMSTRILPREVKLDLTLEMEDLYMLFRYAIIKIERVLSHRI